MAKPTDLPTASPRSPQVHGHLWRTANIGFVHVADFAGELCRQLEETVAHTVSFDFGHRLISADTAIPLGLLINELVTNSAKHAYPGGPGEIRVSASRAERSCTWRYRIMELVFRRIFDFDQPRTSLGFKVIKSLLAQLDGRIAVASNTPSGIIIQFDLPLETNSG